MSNIPAFIYVFKEADRDKLLSLRYELVKNDENSHIYIFLNNKTDIDFSCKDINFALSDILTF